MAEYDTGVQWPEPQFRQRGLQEVFGEIKETRPEPNNKKSFNPLDDANNDRREHQQSTSRSRQYLPHPGTSHDGPNTDADNADEAIDLCQVPIRSGMQTHTIGVNDPANNEEKEDTTSIDEYAHIIDEYMRDVPTINECVEPRNARNPANLV